MLRFLAIALDIAATICAILSPVAILHWLLKAINASITRGLVEGMAPIFAPFNGLLDMIFKDLPTIGFSGQQVPITQGITGVMFTLVFFALAFGSDMVKATMKKVEVRAAAVENKKKLAELKVKKQQHTQKVTTNRRILVFLYYQFQQNPMAGQYFEQLYPRHRGKAIEITPESMLMEFETLDTALRYCIESTHYVRSYYATLRPMDPQPPFYIGVHAQDMAENVQAGKAKCYNLCRFGGQNSMVFSQDIKHTLDANGLSTNFQIQSLGVYDFPNEAVRSQEVFRLLS